MSAPREQADLRTNFQLSLSLSEGGELIGGPLPPPPLPPPKRPIAVPLPAAPMLKYESKIFEMEVEDRGLRWKRVTRKNPRIKPGDESFNFMCQPFLENRLTSLLAQAGCTSDNKIIKIVEKGISEHENPFCDDENPHETPQVPRFEVPDSELRPFGTLIPPPRIHTLTPGESPTTDPNVHPSLQTLTFNLQLCNTCFGIAKKISSPGPRLMPDPTKFKFRKSETPRTPVSERRILFDPTNDLSDPLNRSNQTNSQDLTRGGKQVRVAGTDSGMADSGHAEASSESNVFANNLSYDPANNPSVSDLTGLQSVSYTTKSGRVTTRLTPSREGRMAPPPPPPPAREA